MTRKRGAALVHNVHGDLAELVVPIDGLVLDPKNARQHSDRNIDAIKSSLGRFGQRKPIIVQRDGMVVRAGNGTLTAARALGWTGVAALIVDENDTSATAFALVDNRSAELAEWDWAQLDENLQALESLGDADLSGLGWTPQDLDALALASDWQDAEPPPAGTGQGRAALNGTPIKFTPGQREEVDRAIALAKSRTKGLTDDAEAIVVICRAYVEKP